ncbi:molybdopterin molybdotransferase MoeA [Proteiniclasticum ruminis]|uniref:molybdopterin molybdotransferase MoeA n=1 Tax=Proteiniclasticum ruminis TaxID=398199 RepID=UPI00289BAAC5|nr:gephyrin-like molybdotransferase Glp [Proteiniclasticum ruminis]
MKLLVVDTLDVARRKLLEAAGSWRLESEQVKISEAIGRVLSEDVYSLEPVPNFRRSSVDGYAVRARDTEGASESLPVFLGVVEEVLMGEEARSDILTGQCAYVPTGGMIPEGADAMVMVEYCESFDENSIAVYDAVSPGRNMVSIGEDMKANTKMLSRGTVIRPQEIGAMASAGIREVPVYKEMRLSIISTGDELVDVDCIPDKGQIYDINTCALEALAKKHGFKVVHSVVLKDDELLLKETVQKAMEFSDMVVVSGGSSQGKKDVTAKVIDEIGTPGVFTHGLALKPGKPTIGGYDMETETILIGLPGHPVAAMMVFELICVWILEEMTGKKKSKVIYAAMETNVASAPGKSTCQPVELLETENGYMARPIFGKSGLITTLTRADGYTIIDMNKEGLKPGEVVQVQLF